MRCSCGGRSVMRPALLKTGDVADARLLAESATAGGLPAAVQAERLQLLAEVEWDDGSIGLATAYLEQALSRQQATRRSAPGSRRGWS